MYNRLDCKQIYIPPNLTGMDARDKEINSWIKQSEVNFLVIYGMPGSGKSTLAKYIVYSNWQNFESISIVEDIGSKCKEQHGMLQVQEQLCKDILKGKDRRIPSVCQGTTMIEGLLDNRKALIVLDDIVKDTQLEDILGSGNIHEESKIIITTNNDLSHWFKSKSNRCLEYEMKLLHHNEALELLCLHAFRSKIPIDGFEELAEQVVRYCEGNPLALEVLGSSLSEDNTIRSWKSALKLLGKDIHVDIKHVLKRSYDSLPYENDKELFLHIACFFIGKDLDYVVKILEPEYSAEWKIKTLIKRCFLYVTPNKKLMMHRLFQEMGIGLVDEESRELSRRSRLWRNEESYDVLRKGKSSETMEGLVINMHKLIEEDEFNSIQLEQLSTNSLQQMDRLRLLQLNYVKLSGSYKIVSKQLRWLCWFGFNQNTIHFDIFMGHLVALDMSYSCLEVFEPPTVLKSLKILNLKDSYHLLEIRNMYQIPNLESLIIWNCHNLFHVCKTLGNLEKLELLDMTGCKKLCKMEKVHRALSSYPSTSDGESAQEISLPLPRSLQRLFLKNCNLECTDCFPLSFGEQLSLQYVNLGNSMFEELPSYIHLKHLRVLDLSLCSKLKWLLCLPSTLAELYIHDCKSIEKVTFESGRYTLQEIGYRGCINLSEIEGLLKLVLIAKLDEADLGHMMWLKEYENHDMCLVGDDELTRDRSCHLQMLYEFDIMSTSLPDIKHPKLTPEYSSQSTYLSFEVPWCKRRRRVKGLDVTLRYKVSGDDWAWFCKISTTNCDDLFYNPKVFGKPASDEVGIWLSYWPIGNRLDVGDEVDISIVVMSGLEVLECGARFVYADDDVAGEILKNKTPWVETLGGDLSGFRLKTGEYYLCRRDFFTLMEVGRLDPGWFNILVGDRIESADIRGWRMTGRPRQSYQSFTELKTIGCIIEGAELVTGNSSPSSRKQASTTNVHPTSTQKHVAPARQRSMKRGGGSFNSNVSANEGVSHMSATNQDLVVENPHSTSGKPGTGTVDSSPTGNTHVESQRGGFGSHSHNSNDQQHQRNTYRRSNSGQYSRGDGSYNHSYGGKCDQGRGNHEWNQHSRSFNGRDTHLHPRRGFSRGYIGRSVHTPAAFIPPPPPPMPLPVQTFGNNMMYPDMPSPVFYVQIPPPPPDSLRPMPLVRLIPPPLYFAVPDPLLHSRIVSQIDYYFSVDNLVKDTYLRKNMDEQGWVPVSLIAGFKQVLYLTDNVQLILDAMRASNIVEVQGDKLRRRNDWMRWLMQPPAQSAGSSPNQVVLASRLQGVALGDVTSTGQDSVETSLDAKLRSNIFDKRTQDDAGYLGYATKM